MTTEPRIENRNLILPEDLKGRELKRWLKVHKLKPLRRRYHRTSDERRKIHQRLIRARIEAEHPEWKKLYT